MPMNLSRNQLGVRPCVALLHIKPSKESGDKTPNPEESLIPRLDPKEVASVFTVPLKAFLTAEYKNPELEDNPDEKIVESTVDIDFGTVPRDAGWYEGQWLEWYGVKWRAHQFNVYTSPVVVQRRDSTEIIEDEAQVYAASLTDNQRKSGGGTHDKKLVKYKVWGMTARIVVDAARVAFGKNPDFEFVDKMGDDDVITMLMKQEKLGPRHKGTVEDNGRGGDNLKIDTRKGGNGKL
ncbi:hypothetical protein ABW19_dt0209830 [Dactylella cylindrospora]|nr:hypothetical protein ABW19_dt0209830 [Dactylella cylindrospora]